MRYSILHRRSHRRHRRCFSSLSYAFLAPSFHFPLAGCPLRRFRRSPAAAAAAASRRAIVLLPEVANPDVVPRLREEAAYAVGQVVPVASCVGVAEG